MKANVSPSSKTDMEPVSISRYSSKVSTAKNRITLQQNLFSFLLEGEKMVYYAGTTVQIKLSQFLLLSAGNCLMSEKTTAEGGGYESIMLFFDKKVLSDFFTRYPGVLDSSKSNVYEEPYLLFEKDQFLQNFIQSLDHIMATGQAVSANMLIVKLYELLLYLGENYPRQLQKLRSMSQEEGDEILIRQAVTANINQPVSVEELAFL